MSETIDVETVPPPAQSTQAIQRFDGGGSVGRAMTIDELHKNLEFIRDVMRKEMKEGQDYGKIPGVGDKPTLLQPGAQKLLMTFNLTESVKKEVLREYPNFHREYEFTVTVAAGNGKTWDGVGTCSTLESKYRYRKAQRKCPMCGKNTIIEGKAEYGGGFVCWKKKGGCDAKFQAGDTQITSQPTGDTENEDPADQWNTVRKMAFKRALVAAAINATNTSELWTQDIEEMTQNEEAQRNKTRTNAPGRVQTPPSTIQRPPQPQASAPPKPQAPSAPEKRYATAESRQKLIALLEPQRDLATEYFRKLDNPAVLMPNETLEDLGLQFVPLTQKQAKALNDAITDFGNGAEARHAFPPNELRPVEKPKTPEKIQRPDAAPPAKPAAPSNGNKRGPEWFMDVICPVPHKGQKRDDYLKHPDTIRSLYTQMKEGNEDAGKRLWGFAQHYEAKGWNERPPSNADLVFREALDAFLVWHEKHGEDSESLPDDEQEPRTGSTEDIEDHDVAF